MFKKLILRSQNIDYILFNAYEIFQHEFTSYVFTKGEGEVPRRSREEVDNKQVLEGVW